MMITNVSQLEFSSEEINKNKQNRICNAGYCLAVSLWKFQALCLVNAVQSSYIAVVHIGQNQFMPQTSTGASLAPGLLYKCIETEAQFNCRVK